MKKLDDVEKEDWEKIAIIFRIRSKDLDKHAITNELGLSPEIAFEKGDPIPARGGPVLHNKPWGLWGWSTAGKVSTDSMEDHAEFLLKSLEPRRDAISKYLNDPNFTVSIWIDWQANYRQGGYSLSAPIVQRLSLLCNRLDFGFLKVRGQDD